MIAIAAPSSAVCTPLPPPKVYAPAGYMPAFPSLGDGKGVCSSPQNEVFVALKPWSGR
jgi:hypothetical protein